MVSTSPKACSTFAGSEYPQEVADMLQYSVPDSKYNGVVASPSLFELSKQETAAMMQKWYS